MPSVLIIEDHDVVARLLARVIRKRADLEVTAVVASAEAALEELARSERDGAAPLPTLALIDVSLPGMSGIELLAELSACYPSLRCLMLSGHTDDSYVRRALAAGARGYVVKGNPMELLEAVDRVLAGDIYLSEQFR